MNATNQPFPILLVEDEKTDVRLVEWALREHRYRVDLYHVMDGYEALAFLRGMIPFLDAPRPGLILLDLNMPRMGGLECLAAIRREPGLRDIPVVMLSTSYAEKDMADSRDLGAVDYLTKPMDIYQFAEIFRVLGERWITPRMAVAVQDKEELHEHE